MTISLNHLHVKTRDPKATAQFCVEHLGAKMLGEIGTRGYRVDLHGLQLNITTIIDAQKREQSHGLEHVAVNTDEYTAMLAKLTADGVRVLEELPPGANGRRVCFLEAPDGVQIEVIEKI